MDAGKVDTILFSTSENIPLHIFDQNMFAFIVGYIAGNVEHVLSQVYRWA